MKPLTQDEIATLASIRAGDTIKEETVNLFGRLLDEVGRLRELCGRAADELRGDRIDGTWEQMVNELEAAAGRTS